MHKQKDLNLDNDPMAENAGLTESVPVVDLTRLADGLASDTAVQEIARACRDWGFFQLVNHGIPETLIESVWQKTRWFFALPIAEKESILRSRDNPWGYYNNELTKNRRDKKEVFDFSCPGIDPIYSAQNRWPAAQAEFEKTMLTYSAACSTLCMNLLQAFCRGLDLPGNYLDSDFEGCPTGFVRLNYYPVLDPMQDSRFKPQADLGLGVHHHTDAGALTL